ncbi:HD domain-containing protein [Zobellia uliginosa]|uniref:HD domain-containing protein n=1 Tax=Zobellia uliginosa TaxID=143224 RepID=UPI001C074183|nr:HD domain-containing protein [Zobellia uliginosa]MBU2945774.1 HD domain-containing protein [Zobellia uliginosa]
MKKIIGNAKIYCKGLLTRSRCSSLPFHNIQHTMDVYEHVLKIGMYENRDLQELESVLLAALFHDTGNATVFAGHEKYSVTEASNFLLAQKCPPEKIDLIVSCIKATRMPQRPKGIYEEIICDADLFHLGTEQYQSKNNLLRKEWSKFLHTVYSDADWYSMNIEFMEKHRFFTKYGKEILEPVKQKNLQQLKQYRKRL